MLTVRRGPLARLVLVAVLLLPAVSAAQAASPCAVTAPELRADIALACRTVLDTVPWWDGRAVVQVVDGDPSVAAETLGAVVSVHGSAWDRLTPAGRQEVLTHELVHVATDAVTTPRTPTWLVEGLAEAVALRGSGLPDRVVAQELAASVAQGHLPTTLPTSRDFAVTPAAAYQESWLAVDLLVRSYGEAAVLRFYRAAGVEPLGQALRLLGGRFGSGANPSDLKDGSFGSSASPSDLKHAPESMTVPRLVSALRSEILRRLS